MGFRFEMLIPKLGFCSNFTQIGQKKKKRSVRIGDALIGFGPKYLENTMSLSSLASHQILLPPFHFLPKFWDRGNI